MTLPRSIQTFITRSKELAKADPIISYFCKLYAVELILSQELHTSSDEVKDVAMSLLDDIETTKTTASPEFQEIIHDKESSMAYLLNFSNNIFGNALTQIQEQRVTKQTAMSLMAVANFYELLQLWKEEAARLEPIEEVGKKTKYAKYHAARILKAYKNGEDPNDYIPPKNEFQTEEEEEQEIEDTVQQIVQEGKEEDATEETVNRLPEVPTIISKSSSPEPSIPKFVDDEPAAGDVFKLPETPKDTPGTTEDEPVFTLPETPKSKPKPVPAPQPKKEEPKKEVNVAEILESSEVYSKAQKHAKFAISAMNYEDKATAIKELEQALELLGRLSS